VTRAPSSSPVELLCAALGTNAAGTAVVQGRVVVVSRDGASPSRLRVVVPLTPALDLGLNVRPREFHGPVDEEDPFEATFILGGDEPGRVRDLLDASLREHLESLHAQVDELVVTDDGTAIAWTEPTFPEVASAVARVVDAVRINELLETSAAALRSSVRLRAHADALAGLAAHHALRLSRTPIALAGALDGVLLLVRSERIGWHSHRFSVTASFSAGAAPLGLAMRRARLGDTLEDASSPRTGEVSFDRRFHLVASAEARVAPQDLFDARLCAELLALDVEAGTLALDASGLRFSAVAAELRAEALVAGVVRAARIVASLEDRLARGAPEAPVVAGDLAGARGPASSCFDPARPPR